MRQKLTLTIPVVVGCFLVFPYGNVGAQGMASRAPSGNARYASGSILSEPVDPFANIRPDPAPQPRATAAEIVSARDLEVPEKAAKEFQRSMKAYRSQDFGSAVTHLQKATKIAPGFVQAYNNLGASYLNLRKYDNAVPQFEKAIELDSQVEEPYHNLGLALFLLGRFPEAEKATRHALDLAPGHGNARYMLGRILTLEGKNSAETVEMLRQVTAEYPDARLYLAAVLMKRGAADQAAAELRIYLQKPDPGTKGIAECWLAKITREGDGGACLAVPEKR